MNKKETSNLKPNPNHNLNANPIPNHNPNLTIITCRYITSTTNVLLRQ